jgi:hypothetical protein
MRQLRELGNGSEDNGHLRHPACVRANLTTTVVGLWLSPSLCTCGP